MTDACKIFDKPIIVKNKNKNKNSSCGIHLVLNVILMLNSIFHQLREKKKNTKILINYTHGVFYSFREAWVLSCETYSCCIIWISSTNNVIQLIHSGYVETLMRMYCFVMGVFVFFYVDCSGERTVESISNQSCYTGYIKVTLAGCSPGNTGASERR